MKVIVHTDGGSRGNPGPAAAGFVLDDAAGNRLAAKAFFLGETTNNVAEYTALIGPWRRPAALGATDLTVYTDSELHGQAAYRLVQGQERADPAAVRAGQRAAARFPSCFGSCT